MATVLRITQRVRREAAGAFDPVLDLTRLLWAIEHLLNRTSKLLHRQVGITGPQRVVLRIVQEQPGVSAGEIAKLMHVDKSTLTGVFRRLEERRLIVRELDGADRRRARFRLGPASRGVGFIDVPSLESAVAAAFARAPKRGRQAARDILAAVCARLEWQLAHQAAANRTRPAPRARKAARRRHTR